MPHSLNSECTNECHTNRYAVETPLPRSPIVLSLSFISIALIFIAVHACTLAYVEHVAPTIVNSMYGLIGTSLAFNILFVIVAVIAALRRKTVHYFFVSNVLFLLMCLFDLVTAIVYVIEACDQKDLIVSWPACAPAMSIILLPLIAEVVMFEAR
ncbi:hypothetical protein SprV_0501837100 [Sparganum proliferum]